MLKKTNAALPLLGIVLSICFFYVEAYAAKTESIEGGDPGRMEWALLPAIGYNSDIGFRFGLLTILTKFNPAYSPYRWLIEARFVMSTKKGPDGWELPVHDHFFSATVPGLLRGRLRLRVDVGFEKNIIAPWYGLGNDSSANDGGYARRFQYKFQSPYGEISARVGLWHALEVLACVRYNHWRIDFWRGEPSQLELDIAASENSTGERLFGYRPHSKLELVMGLLFDSRDDEVSPSTGGFYEVSLRGAPGALTRAAHNFGGVNLSASHFIPLRKRWLVLGLRLVGDVLFGDVSYYELHKMKGVLAFYALGGEDGVRGVPAGRYAGKAKVVGNMELRSVLWRFCIKSHRFALGAVVFFDAGRVWYHTTSGTDLDGDGLGGKFGVGGGPQILWGKSVVIRLDVAYSPDATPLGIYLEAGRNF